MRIFIIAKTEEICGSVAAALDDLGAECIPCCDESRALPDCDAVIVSAPLRGEFGLNYVAETSRKTSAPMIVLARADIAEDVQSRIKFTGAFVLAKPFPKSLLAQTVKMALVAKENMNRLEQEKTELLGQLDDVKAIDRAKCCLIEYLNLTENQAHRHIQKLAMDTRRTQREIAEDILRTYSGMTTL
ncbi:MAG: ANTAR domain-containing protein [Ruminococcaceae bacterium]|nr:ANTAR domain-containing protein [Oscillospiraceae bacterium]